MTKQYSVQSFVSISSLLAWAETNQWQKVEDCTAVLKGNLWYYFSKNGKSYNLLMTSLKLLGEE